MVQIPLGQHKYISIYYASPVRKEKIVRSTVLYKMALFLTVNFETELGDLHSHFVDQGHTSNMLSDSIGFHIKN